MLKQEPLIVINYIATSVSYIRKEHKIIMKTIHHVMNVMSTEATLCHEVRCGMSHILLLSLMLFQLPKESLTHPFICINYTLFFFFLIQQFITQCAKADCGNYFRSYIHKMHTNMKLKLKGKKEKRN